VKNQAAIEFQFYSVSFVRKEVYNFLFIEFIVEGAL